MLVRPNPLCRGFWVLYFKQIGGERMKENDKTPPLIERRQDGLALVLHAYVVARSKLDSYLTCGWYPILW